MLENKLKEKEDTINENERGLSFNRGFFYYLQQSYLVYECKIHSFNFNNGRISEWKSTRIFNYANDSNMKGIEDPKTKLPKMMEECMFLYSAIILKKKIKLLFQIITM